MKDRVVLRPRVGVELGLRDAKGYCLAARDSQRLVLGALRR